MKEYYFNQYQKSVLKLEMARVGAESKMKEYATQLLNEEPSLHGPILDAMCLLRTAIEEMSEDANYDKVRYQEVCKEEEEQNAKDSE